MLWGGGDEWLYSNTVDDRLTTQIIQDPSKEAEQIQNWATQRRESNTTIRSKRQTVQQNGLDIWHRHSAFVHVLHNVVDLQNTDVIILSRSKSISSHDHAPLETVWL